MEYTVVFEHGTADLIKVVNQLIGQGWIPLGGVSPLDAGTNNGTYYCQAMTRQK